MRRPEPQRPRQPPLLAQRLRRQLRLQVKPLVPLCWLVEAVRPTLVLRLVRLLRLLEDLPPHKVLPLVMWWCRVVDRLPMQEQQLQRQSRLVAAVQPMLNRQQDQRLVRQ